MLSRDCDGCPTLRACRKRFRSVTKGEKVYCSNGTVHLVDCDSICQNVDLYVQHIECFH